MGEPSDIRPGMSREVLASTSLNVVEVDVMGLMSFPPSFGELKLVLISQKFAGIHG